MTEPLVPSATLALEKQSTPGILNVGAAAPLNPLPPGMRDLLPPKARFQSRVGSRIMRSFELFGYGRVWLPTFEYADVLERTRAGVGSALRFVEPEEGEIVALRADMTPQVARVVSSRYRNAPLPARLCYQGSVLRRRRERARTESQVVQAGIELVGAEGLTADYEVIEVVCAAIRAAGLREFVLNIGHAGIAKELLDGVAPAAREAIKEALSTKDTVVLERRGRDAGLAGASLPALVAMADLHGGQEVTERAVDLLRETDARDSARELQVLFERVSAAGLAPKVVVDFGETSRFDYYSGSMFQVLAQGPGEPLASGGRYDNLYPRFGLQRSAAGCAFDMNNVCWALETAGWIENEPAKLVAGPTVSGHLLNVLRGEGIACAVSNDNLDRYAAVWGFGFSLVGGEHAALRLSVSSRDGMEIAPGPIDQQARQIVEFVRAHRART